MVRYHDDDDSGSSRTLLITAGVLAGVLAGAVVAQRFGGWKGVRRLLKRRRSPLYAALGRVLPGGTLATLLDVVGIEEMVRGLLDKARRPSTRSRLRRHDPDLDEYEVDEIERAAAGLDDEEDGRHPRASDEDVLVDDGEEGESEAVRDEDEAHEVDARDDEEALDEDEDEEEEDEIVETISAEELEDEVLAAFRRHPVLRQRALEIAADDHGVVELTGWVRRERDARMARRVAARVPGVERVVVDIAVREASRDTASDTGREAGRDAVRTAADARKA